MGSTQKIYFHGLFASLASLVAASVFSLLVVRLSLEYLGKQEYGLLSIVAQAAAYVAILDLGMTLAFSRILIDYTAGTKERYANALRTATLVFNLLGLVGAGLTLLIAFFGGRILSIPSDLSEEFFWLMIAQSIFVYATFALKPITAPLMAHGKHHLVYWIVTLSMILNGAVFWIALANGVGIYSTVIGFAIAYLASALIAWRASLPYRPAREQGLHIFDQTIFREVLSFSKDSLVWQIGGQTMGFLPIFLASVWFSLADTADLSGGIKLILLATAVCTRFGDMSVTPLSMEFAKGNHDAAARQMTRIVGISGGIGVFAAIFIICVNPSFLAWWMLGKVHWSWHENVTAAVWVAILTVAQCLYGYAVISRQMKIIRWALLLECALYVSLAFFGRSVAGPSALLWAKPIATLAIAFLVARQIRIHTTFDTRGILPAILRQFLTLALLTYPALLASEAISRTLPHPLLAFIGNAALAAGFCLITIPLLFTSETRADLFLLANRFFQSLLRKSQVANLRPQDNPNSHS